MRKSVLLVPAAILLALAAGFWLGRSRANADAHAGASVDAPSSLARPESGTSATSAAPDASAPGRDYANEDAISAGTADNDPFARALTMPTADANQLPPAPPRPASPTENRLLGERGLRADDQQNVLMNPHFGQVIDSLSHQATADSLEMTRIYRDALAASMKSDPRFQIDRMACGAHLCVLTAKGPVGQDDAFGNFLMGQANNPKSPKFYAVMPGSLPPVGNSTTTEYRMMFTIDPKFNAFEGHW